MLASDICKFLGTSRSHYWTCMHCGEHYQFFNCELYQETLPWLTGRNARKARQIRIKTCEGCSDYDPSPLSAGVAVGLVPPAAGVLGGEELRGGTAEPHADADRHATGSTDPLDTRA